MRIFYWHVLIQNSLFIFMALKNASHKCEAFLVVPPGKEQHVLMMHLIELRVQVAMVLLNV